MLQGNANVTAAAAIWAPAASTLLALVVRRIFNERQVRWQRKCRLEDIRLGLDPNLVEGQPVAVSSD